MGLQVIADLKAKGLLRPIVVVGLGTNGPVTAGQISQLFAEIGPDHKLVLVNTFENRPWEQEVNAILAAGHVSIQVLRWRNGIRPSSTAPACSGRTGYTRGRRAGSSTRECSRERSSAW
jgi:hypothetical protein